MRVDYCGVCIATKDAIKKYQNVLSGFWEKIDQTSRLADFLSGNAKLKIGKSILAHFLERPKHAEKNGHKHYAVIYSNLLKCNFYFDEVDMKTKDSKFKNFKPTKFRGYAPDLIEKISMNKLNLTTKLFKQLQKVALEQNCNLEAPVLIREINN